MPEKDPKEAQPLSPGNQLLLEQVAARTEHPAYTRKRCPNCGGAMIETADGFKCREFEGHKDELANSKMPASGYMAPKPDLTEQEAKLRRSTDKMFRTAMGAFPIYKD